MATATVSRKRVKKPAKKLVAKPTTKRTRPLLTADELKEEEAYYMQYYPNIVPGSICNRGDDPEHNPHFALKRSVVIKCSTPGCREKRRLATSDLHQADKCEAHTMEERAKRKNEARRKATKKKARRRPK